MKITIPAGYILYYNRGKGDESDLPVVEEDTTGFYTTGAVFFQHDKGMPWVTHFIPSVKDLEELGING